MQLSLHPRMKPHEVEPTGVGRLRPTNARDHVCYSTLESLFAFVGETSACALYALPVIERSTVDRCAFFYSQQYQDTGYLLKGGANKTYRSLLEMPDKYG